MSDNSELAVECTVWAQDRTILARVRRFAGDLRAVFGAFEPAWLAKAVASMFILLGASIFAAAQTLERLTDNQASAQPVWRVTMIALTLLMGDVGTGGILWTLKRDNPPCPVATAARKAYLRQSFRIQVQDRHVRRHRIPRTCP